MRYAMISTLVNKVPHAVGTIDVSNKGFAFETKDSKLAKLLREVQKKGIWTFTGGGKAGDLRIDKEGYVKVTEDKIGVLQVFLGDNGYYWWEDRS